MMTDLRKKFTELYGVNAHLTEYFSPGRINLIGEHTDYNGGYVFPASITIGTSGIATKRTDTKVRVYSTNFEDKGIIEFELNDLSYKKKDNWANYVKGMLLMIRETGRILDFGFDLVIEGTIPNGSGLSSSASLELLIGVLANDLYRLDLSRLEMAKLGKKTENEYIGVNSGIMDQFAIAFGEENKAILLDCHTLDYTMVPVELGEYAIVIMNTNKRRELIESKYNERRSQCEEALHRLQTKLDIQSLGELTKSEFEENSGLIVDEILIKRARHAVYENARTKEAKEALTVGNLTVFGKLLNASHKSLKNDYEVTGIELDTLAENAQKEEGVLGARMTGAGFGGCAIALVKEDRIPQFEENLGKIYEKTIGYAPSFYVAHIGKGAAKVGGESDAGSL